MKRLSILLLYYKESADVAAPMLTSLENQERINWDDIELLVCSSSLDALELDLTPYPNLNRIACRVKQDTYATGPGASWRVGLQAASGEYVWKLDIDDELYNNHAVFNAFKWIDFYNSPAVLQLSYEDAGMQELHYAKYSSYWSLAPWAWFIKTALLRDNDLLPNQYLVTKEDLNFISVLSYWIEKPIPGTDEIIYRHIDRKGSETHGINDNPFVCEIENYHYFVANCNYFKEHHMTIPRQVFVTFLWQWWLYAKRLENSEQEYISSLVRKLIKKYFILINNILQHYKEDVNRFLFSDTLLLHIQGGTTLKEFKETLMSIQAQSLITRKEFDVRKLQVLCWGDISDEIMAYDYALEFPLIDNGIMLINNNNLDEVWPFILSPHQMLTIEAGKTISHNDTLYKFYSNQ